MLRHRLVVLISGAGTNLQAILQACKADIIPADVVMVVSNRSGAFGLQHAQSAGIPTKILEWDRKTETREMYDARLAAIVMKAEADIVVLAGWMHLLTMGFLRHFNQDCVINLHPALPDQFPGAHAIEEAYRANVHESGVMVHTVVPKVDAGRVILALPVSRFPNDTLEQFKHRIQYVEKTVLINGLAKHLAEFEYTIAGMRTQLPPPTITSPVLMREGKVRDVYDMGTGMLMMVATDRLSSFDRNVCSVPHKGHVLNKLSAWWFEKTQFLVPNHLIYADEELPVSIVQSCSVFPIEFVVRGVITGSTSTSMWTRYQAGQREFGGHTFEDGLKKNQLLPRPIVDPTTKSIKHDEPVTKESIVAYGMMSREDFEQCQNYAIDLYEAGVRIAAERGLLLADTKYEFGRDATGEIVLVDELHTCDSSRYWDLKTYYDRFARNEEPIRFDKDMIREWLKEQCNPYTVGELPAVPDVLIQQVSDVYTQFYNRLTGLEFQPGFRPHAIALAALKNKFLSSEVDT